MPSLGRFLTRDTWNGNANNPMSFNRWNYVNGNPVNYIDPSGNITVDESEDADILISKLFAEYNVKIIKDWGYRIVRYSRIPSPLNTGCVWIKGNWESNSELEMVRDAVNDMAYFMGNSDKFKKAMKNYPIHLTRPQKFLDYAGLTPILPGIFGDFILYDNFGMSTVVHELAHVWDVRRENLLSEGMMYATGAYTSHCQEYQYQDYKQTVCTATYDINQGSEIGPSQYAYDWNNAMEDWAESFMGSVYPSISRVIVRPIRKQFVLDAVNHIPDAAFWR